MKKLLFAAIIIFAAALTTHAQTRMIAESFYRYDTNDMVDKAKDSTDYFYVAGSGRGNAPGEEKNYDTAVSQFLFTTAPQLYRRRVQTFDANDHILSVTTEEHINGNWAYDDRHTNSYNSSGQLLSDTLSEYDMVAGVWKPYIITVNAYNTAGRIEASYALWLNGGTGIWDTNSRTSIYYNTAGDVVLTTYDEDHAGNLVADDSAFYTYNSSRQLVHKYNKVRVSATTNDWVHGEAKTYRYDASGRLVSEHEQTDQWGSGHLDTTSRYVNTYDAAGNIKTVVYSWKDGLNWKPNDSTTLRYNSDHHLTYSRTMQWDGFAWANTFSTVTFNYYYGPYTPTTITNISNTATPLKLYPVPATNTLYIQTSEKEQQHYTVTITDMQGKQVLHNTYIGNTTRQLEISTLPAGMYNITLLSTKGAVQHGRFIITR